MKRLTLSLVAALATIGGWASTGLANDGIGGPEQDVYQSTTKLPLVAISGGTGECSCADACDLGCDDCCGNWFDNTYVFTAADSWKNSFDFFLSNNFGYRSGFNTGFTLIEGSPIRGQFGASLAFYDLKGGLIGPGANQAETQVFVTVGISKRSDICAGDAISWGFVYDYMTDNNFGIARQNVQVGQFRGIFGYAWDEANEFGVWGAFRAQSDNYLFATVQAQNQVNAFWHHNWEFGGDTMVWSGWADDPGAWTFGASGQVPLNENVALFGATNYIIPDASAGPLGNLTEIWNVSFGLVYYFGGKACSPNVSGPQCLPLLPVADNGTFAIQPGGFEIPS